MKKIILILALALGVKVNAQIVGGYLPLNSTKTATMGGLKVAGNETVTGTFSVGSTATVTGVLNTNSVSNSATGYVRGGYLQANGTNGFVIGGLISGANRIVNNSGTFQFINSSDAFAPITVSTMSLGSANLTGGNTGTVAVLSDAVFCTQSSTKPYDPADGLTIYFANSGYLGLTTNATNNRIYVPKNCTLIGYDITGYTDGSSGTAETSTISIRIDNTTDVTLNSSITYSATYQQWHSMALSTDINAGSYFNLKWVTPTWVTNPTSVVNSVVLWFKLR